VGLTPPNDIQTVAEGGNINNESAQHFELKRAGWYRLFWSPTESINNGVVLRIRDDLDAYAYLVEMESAPVPAIYESGVGTVSVVLVDRVGLQTYQKTALGDEVRYISHYFYVERPNSKASVIGWNTGANVAATVNYVGPVHCPQTFAVHTIS